MRQVLLCCNLNTQLTEYAMRQQQQQPKPQLRLPLLLSVAACFNAALHSSCHTPLDLLFPLPHNPLLPSVSLSLVNSKLPTKYQAIIKHKWQKLLITFKCLRVSSVSVCGVSNCKCVWVCLCERVCLCVCSNCHHCVQLIASLAEGRQYKQTN